MKTNPSLLSSLQALTTVVGAFLLVLSADPARAASPTVTTLGTNAGGISITGTDDTAIGNSALQSDTSGSFNTAVGSLTLTNNVVGIDNSAFGYGALRFNVGNYNTALGGVALYTNNSGQRNVAVGYGPLFKNTTGSLNTALGFGALYYNTTGSSNVATGNQALLTNVGGSFNVAVGDGALYKNTGSGNIGIGDDGGYNLATGSNNIYIGNPGGTAESGIIRIGYTLHTDTYLAGVIHGNGSGLTGITSAGLAANSVTSAQIAAGAVGLGKVAAGAITVGNLAAGAPVGVQVLGYNGTNLTWTSPAGGWSLNGTSAFYNGGNVGIGTNSPVHKLAVIGGPAWTSNFWTGSIELAHASAIGWHANDAGQRLGIGHTDGGFSIFRTSSDPGTTTAAAVYDFFISDSGDVGIGTTFPTTKLEIVGAQHALGMTGFGPDVTFRDTGNSNARSVIQSVAGDLNFFAENYMNGSNLLALLKLSNNGNVGIGTPNPQTKLDIVGSQHALAMTGFGPDVTFKDTGNGYARNVIQSIGGTLNFFTESYMSGSNTNNYAQLSNAGIFSVKAITIRGGADLAEPFQMNEEEALEKGSVVVIDDEHPGRLKRSRSAYDTRVAGIVSGANGVNPGIALHQEGILEGGQNVALTGRVYVRADASGGPIKPGDLLTTSDLPGHAMKVADHGRAQGAILGKAMSSLESGEGMVLVLVTLQ